MASKHNRQFLNILADVETLASSINFGNGMSFIAMNTEEVNTAL